MWRPVLILAAVMAGALSAQQPSAPPPALEAFVEGRGRTVVLLDAGINGAVAFEPHARVLASDFRVVRMQTLGLDRARKQEPLPEGYSLDMESAAMARALDRLAITGPVDIVSASFGGLVALDFALDNPQRVRTLALFEPPVFWAMTPAMIANDPAMAAMIDVIKGLTPFAEPTHEQLSAFLCALGTCGAEPPDDGTTELKMWEQHRASLRGMEAFVTHRDSADRLKTLAKPVLLMTGAESVDFHRRVNDALAAQLPRVERAEVTGAHLAPMSARDEFIAKWRAFADEGSGRK